MLAKISSSGILKNWHTHGALWLMENPTFAEDYEYYMVRAVERCTTKDATLLEDAARMSLAVIRMTVARNIHTPPHILQFLATDTSPTVRANVAQNSKTPIETLQMLMHSPDSICRYSVAKNARTPVEWLRDLANDASVDVRATVCRQLKCPQDILEKNAHGYNTKILYAVAKNENVSASILRILYNNIWSHRRVLEAVAQHDFIPQDLLPLLAKHDNSIVRQAVAFNRKTPIELLDILSDDPCQDVRYYVANNNKTPTSILYRLLNDEYVLTKEQVKVQLEARGCRYE